jgi:hypothetical protein
MGKQTQRLVECLMIHGRNGYVKYKCRCDVCRKANSDYKKSRRPVATFALRLDGSVLVERLRADDRLNAVGKRSAQRWVHEGIDVYNADRMCIKLGYHPVEIWGQKFYEGCHGE